MSPAAADALQQIAVDTASLFARHQRGDWGSVADGLVKRNNRSVGHAQPDYHAIHSRYELADGVVVVVVTSVSRARTRLQLEHEYRTVEVASAEGYAIWADEYDTRNHLALAEEKVVRPILQGLKGVENVADIGTGTGRYALSLAPSCSRVVGVDESQEMLAVANSKAQELGLTNVEWIQAPLAGPASLPLPANSFDLLVSALMLTHVTDLHSAIAECARIVRPGGILLFTDFHPATRWFRWRTTFATPDAWYNFPNPPHAREDYLDALARAGCAVREVHDLASDGTDYGDVSEQAVIERGDPPRSLVLVGVVVDDAG